MGLGDVGHVLTNTVAGSSDQDWTCFSSNVYSRDGSAGHGIEYDGTNWIDHSSADWPTHFGTSSTDSTVVTPVGSDTDLYLWNGSTFVCKLVNDDPESSGSGGGSGGFLNVNTPNIIWHFPNKACGETTYVSVTHTATTSSATTYTLHNSTGQIGTILVGTASDASANVSFTILADTYYVKDSSGNTLSARVFTCGGSKVFRNFW